MIFKIPVPIYKTHVHILVDVEEERAIKYYNKFGGEFQQGIILGNTTEARCIADESGLVFAIFKANPSRATVAHELFHAMSFILHDRGLTLSSGSEEAFAYLLAYLIDEFYIKTAVKAL